MRVHLTGGHGRDGTLAGSGKAICIGSGVSLALPSSLTWRDLAVKTYREVVDDDVLGLAAQLSYYFFLALFPAILFGLALASFFPLAVADRRLVARPRSGRVARGPDTHPDQMRHLANAESGGLLTFGVLGALGAVRRHWSRSSAP